MKKILVAVVSLILILGLTGCLGERGTGEGSREGSRDNYIPSVLIYEAYMAGGYFSGSNYAPYQNNYVVLYNSSDEPVSLEGWMLAACTSDGMVLGERSALLSGTIEPDTFYVIQGGKAPDAFVHPIGEPLPFDVDLVADTLSPERRGGILALYRHSKTGAAALGDRNLEDWLSYGAAELLVSEDSEDSSAENDSASDPTLKRVLRRISLESTGNNAADFQTVNIFDRPANIIRYTTGLTGTALSAGSAQTSAEVTLSHNPGVYGEEFDLELATSLDGGAKIYYTLDGTAPVSVIGTILPSAIEYTGPINIRDRTGEPSELIPLTMTTGEESYHAWPPIPNEDETEDEYRERLDEWFSSIFKGNVVRAAAVNGDKVVTPTVTASYFVSEIPFAERYNMPVVSILTDKDGLYDPDTGIFMFKNLTNRELTNRIPAVMHWFEQDGTFAFTEDIRFQLHGGASREMPQKSFRIYTTNDNFSHDLFGGYAKNSSGQTITHFDRFILRMGGQDRSWGGLRDPFWQRFCGQLGTFGYQAARPVTVFINGEYWGTYFITERQDDHYISDHYGIPREDVVMIEAFSGLREGDWGDEVELHELRQFIINNDMTVASNYQRFTDIIDVESYIDIFICSTFAGNSDFPHNNIRMWKNRNPEATEHTKWKMLMCDVDATFNLTYTPDLHEFLHTVLNYDGAFPENAQMFSSLMKNSEFKEQFISRAEYLLETFFDPEAIIQAYVDLRDEITPAFDENQPRWNIRASTWEAGIEEIMSVVPERYVSFREELERLKN